MFFSNLFTSVGSSIYIVYVFRFLTGFFQNMNTIGKDIIFEFFSDGQSKKLLNLEMIAEVFGLLVSPLIGLFIYNFSGQQFTLSCVYISMFFAANVILFFFFFYIINIHPVQEEFKLIKFESTDILESKNFFKFALFFLKKDRIRNIMITQSLVSCVITNDIIISTLYLQVPFNHGGLDLTSAQLSYASSFSFFPSLILFFNINRIVPDLVPYNIGFRFLIALMSLQIIITPLLRDWVGDMGISWAQNIALVNQFLKFSISPKLFSPILTHLLNRSVNKNMRTSVNAVYMIFNGICQLLALQIIVPLLSVFLYDKSFENIYPYNKDLCF